MRKPRDFDAELRALQDRQNTLRARRTAQLGELVQATGADALPIETLAGALLEATDRVGDQAGTEAWRKRGEAFFRGRSRSTRTHGADDAPPTAPGDHASTAPDEHRTAPR